MWQVGESAAQIRSLLAWGLGGGGDAASRRAKETDAGSRGGFRSEAAGWGLGGNQGKGGADEESHGEEEKHGIGDAWSRSANREKDAASRRAKATDAGSCGGGQAMGHLPEFERVLQTVAEVAPSLPPQPVCFPRYAPPPPILCPSRRHARRCPLFSELERARGDSKEALPSITAGECGAVAATGTVFARTLRPEEGPGFRPCRTKPPHAGPLSLTLNPEP